MIARTEVATRNGCTPISIKTRDGAGRVVGVQRAENEVTGETGVDRDAGGLEIANFTDHDDVRRLAQDGAQRRRESHADLGIHLHLIDPVHLIFDRVFDGDDLAVRFVDVIEAGVERGRLAGAGRAGDEQNAVRQLIRRSKLSWSSRQEIRAPANRAADSTCRGCA